MRLLIAAVAALLLGAATVGVGYAIDGSASAHTKPSDALGPVASLHEEPAARFDHSRGT